MTKTKAERIEDVKQKIEQLQNQKKKLLQDQKTQERKARTKRLIERGAILESLISEAELLTNEQISSILKKTVGSSYGSEIVTKTKKQTNANELIEEVLQVEDG